MLQTTTLVSTKGPVGKRFTVDDDRLKITNCAAVYEATAKTVKHKDLAKFARALQETDPYRLFTYGLPVRDGLCVPQDVLHQHPGAIARDRKHFSWPEGEAIMLLDYDPIPGQPVVVADELIHAVREACPIMAMAPLIHWYSSSSFIYRRGDDAFVRLLVGPLHLHRAFADTTIREQRSTPTAQRPLDHI